MGLGHGRGVLHLIGLHLHSVVNWKLDPLLGEQFDVLHRPITLKRKNSIDSVGTCRRKPSYWQWNSRSRNLIIGVYVVTLKRSYIDEDFNRSPLVCHSLASGDPFGG